MAIRRLSPWAFGIVGAAVFLVLHLHVAAAWATWYGPFRYLGSSEQVMVLPPVFFTNSPRSLAVGVIALCLVPLGTLWFRAGRRRAALLGLYLGVLAAVFVVVAASPGLHAGGSLVDIAMVAVLLLTGLPLLIGAVGQAVLEEGITLRRRSRNARHEGADADGAA